MSLVGKIKAMMVSLYNYYYIKRRRHYVVNSNHSVVCIDKTKSDFRKKGFSIAEAMLFQLNSTNYKDYISTWESYQPRLINSPFFKISDDKYLFYLVFSHYVKTPECYALIQNRKIIWLKSEFKKFDLYDFIIAKGGCVIKDRGGCDGFNVYVLYVNNIGQLLHKNSIITKDQLNEITNQCSNAIVQERLIQGVFENELYPNSINTIRLISILNRDTKRHEIVAAVQRIGTQYSISVDNFNQGGGSSLIDLATGELGPMRSMFHKDEEGNYIAYDKHPNTGTQIKGRKIPNWDGIKKMIVDLSQKVPFFEYIAWDIALLDNEIAIIETNMKSSLNVFQIHKPMLHSFLGDKYREHGWLVDHN